MGFQHGHIFKITCAKDRSTIMVGNGNMIAGSVLMSGNSQANAIFQKFKTELLPDSYGEFRVAALSNSQETLVWDYMPNDRFVFINNASWSINQIWTCERVYPGNDQIVLIKANDGKCLRSMGKNQQLELAFRNPSDSYQHWILQPTTSY